MSATYYDEKRRDTSAQAQADARYYESQGLATLSKPDDYLSTNFLE